MAADDAKTPESTKSAAPEAADTAKTKTPEESKDNKKEQLAIDQMPRIKRDLVQRKEQIDSEVAALKSELEGMREESPMAGLNAAMRAELARQAKLRDTIGQARRDIRELRRQKGTMATARNETVEHIRDLQLNKREQQLILADKSATDEEKATAKQKLETADSDILEMRKAEAAQSAEIARHNVKITEKIGTVEEAESELSESRKTTQELKGSARDQTTTEARLERASTRSASLQARVEEQDQMAQERRMAAAERITPQSVASELRRRQPIDPDMEAARAGQKIKGAGGFSFEQKAVEGATKEFHQLVSSIKDVRKELAMLQEGTEEYAAKQEESANLESRAADAMKKIAAVEADVERRGMGGGGAAGAVGRAGEMAGGALQFGANLMGRFGDLAASRFTIEEERKNAELRVKGRQLQDVRSSMTDATALLSTFGGRGVTESPYGGSAQVIGEDFAATQRAVPQLQFGLETAAGAARLGGRAVGAAIKGGAINPLTGELAGAGELIQGGTEFGLDTMQRAISTPEVMGAFGGERGAEAIKDSINALGDKITRGTGAGFGKVMGLGGKESGDLAQKAVTEAGEGITQLASGIAAVGQRAIEASKETQKLNAAQQTLTQIERERERIAIAFAPQVQRFIDLQDSQVRTMRARVMTQAERRQESQRLNEAVTDQDLIDRGFTPAQIAAQNEDASRTMGRFGAGGRSTQVARQAMQAESMGLGNAEQSIAGMGRLMRAGTTDPGAIFERAVKQGLMSGIQDSRQFQELLSGVAEVADNTGDVEGALDNVLKGIGGGSPRDVIAATQGAKTIQDEMSGQTGTWMDTLKNAMTQEFTADVAKSAKGMNVKLDRRSITSLQGIANLKPEELDDEAKMRTMLGEDTWAVLEKMGEGKGGAKGALGQFRKKLEIRAATAKSVTATQDQDLQSMVDDIAGGKTDKLKEQFGTSAQRTGKQQKNLQDRFSTLYTGLRAYYDDTTARGIMSRVLREETGGDEKEFQAARKLIPTLAGDYKGLQAAEALAQGKAAPGVMGEQQRLGQAEMEREDVVRGRQITPEISGKRVGEEYKKRLDETERQAILGKTVSADKVKSEKVETLDEAVRKLSDGVSDLLKAVDKFSAAKAASAALQVAGDVVVQGAQAIKGVLLDGAVSSVIKKAGDEVANAIKGSAPAPAPAYAAPATNPAKSVPAPLGGQ